MGNLGAKEDASGIEAGTSTRKRSSLSSQPLLSTTAFFFLQEKVIPSVVIEPASNNEGEGDHEAPAGAEPLETPAAAALPGPTSELPELAAEPKAGEDPQPLPSAPSASEASQEVPPGFLYKVLLFCLVLIWWPLVLPLL